MVYGTSAICVVDWFLIPVVLWATVVVVITGDDAITKWLPVH
jgi:hypothetical protein